MWSKRISSFVRDKRQWSMAQAKRVLSYDVLRTCVKKNVTMEMVFVLNVWVRVRKERKQARRLRQSERAKATEENRVSQKYIKWEPVKDMTTWDGYMQTSFEHLWVPDRNRFEDGALVSRLCLISQSSLHDLIMTVGRFFSVRLLALLSYLNKKQTWDVTNGANKKIHIYALAWNRVMVNSASRTQSVKYPNMPIGTTLRQIATFQWKTRREWIRAAR